MYEVENKREKPVIMVAEDQTSQIPSDIFLWAAVGLVGVALAFKLMNRNHQSLFIGQWVAPFLLFGIYNKMVNPREPDLTEKEMD